MPSLGVRSPCFKIRKKVDDHPYVGTQVNSAHGQIIVPYVLFHIIEFITKINLPKIRHDYQFLNVEFLKINLDRSNLANLVDVNFSLHI